MVGAVRVVADVARVLDEADGGRPEPADAPVADEVVAEVEARAADDRVEVEGREVLDLEHLALVERPLAAVVGGEQRRDEGVVAGAVRDVDVLGLADDWGSTR